jgi:CDP-diacylglycerol--serine O-phosphatidyltransferase
MKNEKNKRSIFKRVRRQRLKYITILPSLVTIINGVCGFSSILLASRGEFTAAAYVVFLAMIADMLDGRLARMSHSTSSFGGQLDSLCDVISFGLAPSFLMLKLVESELKLGPEFFNDNNFFQRFVWLAAASYLSCSAIRLARFNVENEKNESSHMSFIGLPTPAAAGVIVSLIIFYQKYRDPFPALKILLYAMPFIILGIAILMVSRIRYPHLPNLYLRGKKPFGYLIKFLLVLVFLSWKLQWALMLMFCGFATSSVLKWLYYKSGIPRHVTVLQHKAEKDDDKQIESPPELH